MQHFYFFTFRNRKEKHSTTHPESQVAVHVDRAAVDPERDSTVAVVGGPTAAADNARAAINRTCPLIDIACQVTHPIAIQSKGSSNSGAIGMG